MFKIIFIGIVITIIKINAVNVIEDIEHINIVRSRYKRGVVDNETIHNKTSNDSKEIDEIPCVGDKQFCNMTKEDYVAMLYDYVYPQTYEWILISTHIAVFIIGLVGNILVCVAVYRNHTMRTVTNYFLVNLAVADFMVLLFCLPATVLWDVTETWFLGDALCKILLYFQSVSVTVSVLTLTFISLDRWYAICFPLKFKSTINRAKTAIFAIWTVSLVFNVPELIVLTTVKLVPLRFELEYLIQCTATWSSTNDLIWHIVKVVFIYTIPLLLMTVAYYQIVRVLWSSEKIPGQAETIKLASAEQTQLRSRRKAAKMLVAVVIMFAVCYFPVHLLSVLRFFDMEQNDVTTVLGLISHVLCYANSAINPLIYNFLSGKYRREFRRSFCCSTSLTHERLTTMTKLTSSKKKYEHNIDNNRCDHAFLRQNNYLSKDNYGRASLKNQKYDMTLQKCDHVHNFPLKSYSYDHHNFNGQNCDHTSFNNCDRKAQNYDHLSVNGHKCGHVISKCHNCEHVNLKCQNSDHFDFNNGQRRYKGVCTHLNRCKKDFT